MAYREIIFIEIAPTEPDNALEFYVNYLQGLNYTVTERDLSTNTYETVDNFKQFLWLLQYSPIQECYVDYGEKDSLFSYRFIRQQKLWLQLDGVFWEMRIE